MFWRLIKNFYAYLWKNKGSFIGLGSLIFISVFAFSLLKNTSTSLKQSYNKLVDEQKLHNVVVNEFYNDQNKDAAQKKLEARLNELKTFYQTKGIDLTYERTRALIVNAPQQDVNYQLLQYNNNQSLNTFDATTIDVLDKYNFVSYDLNQIYLLAQNDVQDYIVAAKDKYFNASLFSDDVSTLNENELKAQVINDPKTVYEQTEAVLQAKQVPSYLAVYQAFLQNQAFLNDTNNIHFIYRLRYENHAKILRDHLTIWNYLLHELPAQINNGEEGLNTLRNSIIALIDQQANLASPAKKTWKDFVINKNNANPNGLIYQTYYDRIKIDSDFKKETNVVDLNTMADLPNSIAARRFILAQLVYAKWGDNNQLYADFVQANEYAKQHPEYDPLDLKTYHNDPTFTAQTARKVATQFLLILYPSKKGIASMQEVNVVAKAHRMSFSFIPAGVPIPAYFDMQTSYLAVSTPFFLKQHNKKVYDANLYLENISKIHTQEAFEKYFNSISDEFKVYVDTTPYLLIKTGLTPNYMFPIINFSSLIPNPEKEALIYVNNNGFERTFDGFRSNPIENNLYIRLNTKDEGLIKQFTTDLNKWIVANEVMSWPSQIDAAYVAEDTNNKITPAPLRLVFVRKITTTIQTFSSLITLLILALSIFVIVIIVNRFISQNKITIGNLMANGVNRWKIIASFLTVGIIPCLFMGIIAFVSAHFSQSFAIDLLKDYWMVPTQTITFNFGELMTVIIIPFLIFAGIVSLMLWKLTNKNATDLMSGIESNKVSWFVRLWTRHPARENMGFTRYAFILSFSSLSRVILLSLMIMFSFGLILFVTNTRSKIVDSMNSSLTTKRYRFAIEFNSPTKQSSQFHSVWSDKLGVNLRIPDNTEDLNQNYGVSDYSNDVRISPLLNNYLNLKLFGEKDDIRTKYDIGYLTNAFQIKQFLDFNFGLANQITNPWEITRSLIPENSLYMVNRQYDLWASTSVNDHSILSNQFKATNTDQETKNRLAKLAYDVLKIKDYQSLKIVRNNNDLMTYLRELIKQSPHHQFDKTKNYVFDIRLLDDQINFQYLRLVISFDENKQQWTTNQSFEINDTHSGLALAHVYYKEDQAEFKLENDLITNFHFFDDWYFDTYRNDRKFANFQVSFSSYLRARFLKENEQGSFKYQQNFTLPIFKAFIASKYLNQKIAFTLFDKDNAKSNFELLVDDWNDLQFDTKIIDEQPVYCVKNIKTNEEIHLTNQTYYVHYDIDSKKATNQAENNNIANKVHLDYIHYVLLTHPNWNPLFKQKWGGISFNTLVLDPYKNENEEYDEPFVYVDANVTKINSNSTNEKQKQKAIKLIGLVDDSHAVLLSHKETKINDLLFNNQEKDVIPVIINNVFAKYYNLGIGNTLTIKINNHTDRLSSHKQNHTATLKVVAISDNNQELQIYTNIHQAAHLLDLHADPYSSTQANNTIYPFNGIFTNKKSPDILTNITPIFSLSGLYPVQERWSKSQQNINLINNIINPSSDDLMKANDPQQAQSLIYHSQKLLLNALEDFHDIVELKDYLRQFGDERAQAGHVIDLLVKKYGYSTYQALISNVEPVDVMFNVYQTANNTINKIEITIIFLFMLIILLTIILMITNSFNDLLKIARMLKNMGYSNQKNAVLFLLSFLPALLIGIILAVPFSIGLIGMFNQAIFNAFTIFIPSVFVVWHFVVIILALTVIFIILWAIAYYALKKSDVASASKRE
ncbi:ABC transporter permease [Ureaplasma miroungigenitalium]|uniref:ABC transporter permease n=1 Tax=Ureaplasma miroungigenitalium TaxID=1042321 RepID=A0ABT3BN51_9BACT|nr:ABC transporter permease [Ureaplasma miroungigenitalium]MCV3728572.1 ABC transporter permease [Ureaplasma miroungigenitalium]